MGQVRRILEARAYALCKEHEAFRKPEKMRMLGATIGVA